MRAMWSQDKGGVSLFKALEAKGWFWEDDCLYPPHKTFWIRGNDPKWQGALPRIYEQFKASLERMPQIKHLYPDTKHFQEWVEDTEGLVTTLEELMENKSSDE